MLLNSLAPHLSDILAVVQPPSSNTSNMNVVIVIVIVVVVVLTLGIIMFNRK